ncbi:hypothetical protein AAC387_Pa04g0914 [Persea americana]
MQTNLLSGTIPSNFQKLQKLQAITLHDNKLSGKVPSSLGNNTQLFGLHLQRNVLHGSIPRSLGNCRHLEYLRLSNNNLSGAIPEEVLNIHSLISLAIDMNSLTGSFPFDTNKLRSLTQLNITNNKFSGNIPSCLGNCTHLEYLYMKGNFFKGSIPSSLSSLKSTQVLDLSNNNLSGQIPKYLEELPFLHLLNLSSNILEGEVPTLGIFRNTSAISLSGNRKLCGGISELQLPACPRLPTKKQGRAIVKGVVAVGFFLLLSSFLAIRFLLTKSTKKPTSTSFMRSNFLGVTYAMLFKATNGFSSANLIGAGSHGSVYKGLLDCIETPIAIKILKLQQKRSFESFIVECKALGRVQHRNIIKILTVCSSIGFRGNDFKALVFQYMANGSLDMWLHPDENEKLKILNLLQRLDVAIDVAYALDYLHHHCEAPIIHCNLKPGNVLLDDDMVAHLGDFSLARILSNDVVSSSRTQSSMLEMKGSIGYIAPEYGMGGDVSTCGDVYSYGILLLEMLTEKRPMDDIFKENQNLHQFAKMVLLEQVMEIIDHELLSEEIASIKHNESYYDMRCRMHETLVSLVRIGVSCSIDSPKERMQMNDVLIELLRVKEFYLGVGKYQAK